MSLFKVTLSLLGLRGAKETLVKGTKESFDNLGKLIKKRNAEKSESLIDYEKLENERLSGKLRFRQRMVNEGLTESRYLKLNQKQYNYSIALLIGAILLISYSILMMFSGNVFVSCLAITMILVVYLDAIKKATEIREQSYITTKEFLSNRKLWLPTTKRHNDYFNIDDEKQVQALYDEIDQLDLESENIEK